MNIDNITSDGIALSNNGKEMLIKVYEQEIKRLKEDYMMLQNASDEVEEEKDKEIERLNNRITELEKGVSRKEEQITNLDDENFDLENEIERLNNIINEFDKWLLGEKMLFYRSSDNERLIRYGETKNKWLELKGSDKE